MSNDYLVMEITIITGSYTQVFGQSQIPKANSIFQISSSNSKPGKDL
jgi:hypothetical protein